MKVFQRPVVAFGKCLIPSTTKKNSRKKIFVNGLDATLPFLLFLSSSWLLWSCFFLLLLLCFAGDFLAQFFFCFFLFFLLKVLDFGCVKASYVNSKCYEESRMSWVKADCRVVIRASPRTAQSTRAGKRQSCKVSGGFFGARERGVIVEAFW